MENKNLYIDFEAVRNSFFSDGNISVSGKMTENLYLFSGETIQESTYPADISEISGFKALFGDPEINNTSIVTFVVRNGKADEIIAKINRFCVYESFMKYGCLFTNRLPRKENLKARNKTYIKV